MGGKYLRAPQSTAIVLGSERLCKAICWNGAPHQAFGPSMKLSKEEIVGAVVALDRWIDFPTAKHDRDQWLPRLKLIEAELNTQLGTRTEVLSWRGSVTAVRLKVSWDEKVVPFSAEDLRLALLRQRPRIVFHDFWSTPTSIVLDPVNLGDDEAEIVGRASARAFHEPRCIAERPSTLQAEADVSGGWRIEIQFIARRHIISILSRMRCSYQASITPDYLPASCPVRFTATTSASRLHTRRYRCRYSMASRAKSPKMALSVERSSSAGAQRTCRTSFQGPIRFGGISCIAKFAQLPIARPNIIAPNPGKIQMNVQTIEAGSQHPMSLHGKVALIVGGYGAIGTTISEVLTLAGATSIVAGRSGDLRGLLPLSWLRKASLSMLSS